MPPLEPGPEPDRKPSSMTRAEFIEAFGGVFEHSAWIAERAWERGIGQQDDAASVHAVMCAALDDASQDEKLGLLNAHPDLAGRLAVSGKLTAESTNEQASAGLDQCSAEEYERFRSLNETYKGRFAFPFIMAVKGANRAQILAAFETRIGNDHDTEFATALNEVKKIALLRLQDMLK